MKTKATIKPVCFLPPLPDGVFPPWLSPDVVLVVGLFGVGEYLEDVWDEGLVD